MRGPITRNVADPGCRVSTTPRVKRVVKYATTTTACQTAHKQSRRNGLVRNRDEMNKTRVGSGG